MQRIWISSDIYDYGPKGKTEQKTHEQKLTFKPYENTCRGQFFFIFLCPEFDV